MRRRAFIAGIVCTATLSRAEAQQAGKVYRIAIAHPSYPVSEMNEASDRLPWFPASDKKKDPRYRWFRDRFGDRCWELDAMDPRGLRERVEQEIWALIEPVAWERCARVNKAEQASLQTILAGWTAP